MDLQCIVYIIHALIYELLPVRSDSSAPADSVEVMLESVLPPAGKGQQYTRSQYSRSQKSTSGGQGPGGLLDGTEEEKWGF